MSSEICYKERSAPERMPMFTIHCMDESESHKKSQASSEERIYRENEKRCCSLFGQKLPESCDAAGLRRCFLTGRFATGELVHEIGELHVVCGGVVGVEQVHEVLEEIDLAGDPERPVVGVPKLFLGLPEKALEQWMVEVAGRHLELAEDVIAPPDPHPDVAFRDLLRLMARRPEAPGSTAPHLPDNAAHCINATLA